MMSLRLPCAALALLISSATAWGQSDTSAIKAKEIRLLVGYATGGGYDTYARIVGQHLGKQIDGNPTIIVQNMPGADGLTVANHVFARSAKDGSVIAVTNRNMAVAPALGLIEPQSAQYKAEEFTWLANLNTEVSVIIIRRDAKINSIDDLRQRTVIVGSTGLTANNAIYPYVANNLLKTRFKVVTGYPGTSHLVLALERGEIEGIGGWAWSSLLVQKPDWIKDQFIVPLLTAQVDQEIVERLWSLLETDPATPVTVDLATREIRAGDLVASFDVDDYLRWRLMEGLDDVGITLKSSDDITTFEERRPAFLPTTA